MASATPVVTDAATLEEVVDVLQEHVPIEMEGDFQPETLFEILVHAASNAQSIEQTSKTLDASPTGNDVRYHLSKLDDLEALEEQLNEALRSRVPGRLENSRQKLAIDLNLIPYYGPTTVPLRSKRNPISSAAGRRQERVPSMPTQPFMSSPEANG